MDYDDDLARAIALSLMDQQSSNFRSAETSSPGPVDIESRYQHDLQRAIETSKTETNISSSPDVGPGRSLVPSTSNSETGTPTASSSFLSDRAQLERERLARLKRLRGEEHQDERSSQKRQRSSNPEEGVNERTDSASSINSSGKENHSSYNGGVRTKVSNTEIAMVDQLFWDGELRPTANLHSQPRQDVVPLNPFPACKKTYNLIKSKNSQISFAIISSYSTSVSWIYEFFEPRTPVILVAQTGPSGEADIKNVLPNWVMTVPFLRSGRGCQHMKVCFAWSLSYRNAVWLQDLPPREVQIPHDPKVMDDFPSIMQNVLRAANVRPALASMLANDHPNLPIQSINDLRSKWDWSKVKVKLVPSLAGRHEGWPAVVRSGHTRLMKAVRELGLRTGKGKAARDLLVECQGSSIGTYSTQWLNEFHYSARGESAQDWLDEPKGRRTKLPLPPVNILFPSLRTVQESLLGESLLFDVYQGGGTMFCRANQWDASKFPKELFHDSNSAGGRVLMHTKMIIATYRQKQTPFATSSKAKTSTASYSGDQGKGKSKAEAITISDSETESDTDNETTGAGGATGTSSSAKEPIGWAYVGSHNFTPSAWGTLSGSAFNPVLNIVNYELGIVFPLYSEQEVNTVSCFKRPPRKYVLGKDRPWVSRFVPPFLCSGCNSWHME
ncbi:hypothetical protein ID866_7933 [Astraeus odoratus]|nr:hypothetical protein ID866_7933 [Astraeus odoratus]